VSGERLDLYFRKHILGPLEMVDTGFTLTPAQRAREASAHRRKPDGALVAEPLELPSNPTHFSGGGKRFAVNSLEYRVIAEWIAAGTPPPSDSDVQITGLEVYPASAILKPEGDQQLVVRAKYANGQVRDVTRWVKFSSSDEGVATVDDSGYVKMTGFGEAAVTLYYQSKVLYARLAVPYANKIDPAIYTKFQRNNFIDDLVIAKLKALNIAPSAPAADSAFIRRAYLDAARGSNATFFYVRRFVLPAGGPDEYVPVTLRGTLFPQFGPE
jgi:hypothetical protein